MAPKVQCSPWPVVGQSVWVVVRSHSWDRPANEEERFSPGERRVLAVGTGTVILEGETDRPIKDCFIDEDMCRTRCQRDSVEAVRATYGIFS